MSNYYKYILAIFHFVIIGCNESDQEKIEQQNYTLIDTSINEITFMHVPEGPFTFGINDSIRSIDYDFWIMKYEVTNQLYYQFLNDYQESEYQDLDVKNKNIFGHYKGDSLRPKGNYILKRLDSIIQYKDTTFILDTTFKNHPVTGVTWFGAKKFCDFYSYELPNRYEWEKAARGMTGNNYPWGDTLFSNAANYHNSGDPFDNGTTPVGFYNGEVKNNYQTVDNKSPYGCYDMAGNAWEYTNSILIIGRSYLEGAGGGYLYHTGAMCQSWFFSIVGNEDSTNIDRSFISDGFRCLVK